MQPQYLTSLTEKQDAFSDGVSQIWYTPHWDPEICAPEEPTGGHLILAWGGLVEGGTRVFHGIRVEAPETTSYPVAPEPVLVRALCHALVDQVPNPGLPGLFESLSEYRDYYLAPTYEPPQPLLAPVVAATFESPRIRPDFPIGDLED